MFAIGDSRISPWSRSHLKNCWRLRKRWATVAGRRPFSWRSIRKASTCSRWMAATSVGMPADYRNASSWTIALA